MPNTSYRRKLRVVGIEQPPVLPIEYPTSYIVKRPIVKPPPKKSESQIELEKIYLTINETLDMFIQQSKFTEATLEFTTTDLTTVIEITDKYVKYFKVLDIIYEYVLAVENTITDPLDKSSIYTQINTIREKLTEMPYVSQDYSILDGLIKSLIQFIINTIKIDTFKYTLVYTLDKIHKYIEDTIKYDKQVAEIHTLILDLVENIKNQAPSPLISWRVTYIKDLVSKLE